ncbi:hypothetical protein KG091_07875 [Carnobacteriaceae bacterium zg-ZUI78]|nr:hypothetical protein [Carnobacteriaceae bacterium zg-ZUI78]
MIIKSDKTHWAIQGLTAEIAYWQCEYDKLVINDKSNRERHRIYKHIQELGRLRNQFKAERSDVYEHKKATYSLARK